MIAQLTTTSRPVAAALVARRPQIGRMVLAGLAFVLAGCAAQAKLEDEVIPMGDFALGHNVVIAKDMQKGPFSRDATEEEVETAVKKAMQDRFGRYDGDKLYHLGLKIDAYALAAPGVPIVFTPKSVLVITVNIWDDAKGVKLTEEPKLLTVFEGFSGEAVIGTGLTRSRTKQLEVLSVNAAAKIQQWLLENGTWFGMDPADIPAPSNEDPLVALAGKKQAEAEAEAAASSN